MKNAQSKSTKRNRRVGLEGTPVFTFRHPSKGSIEERQKWCLPGMVSHISHMVVSLCVGTNIHSGSVMLVTSSDPDFSCAAAVIKDSSRWTSKQMSLPPSKRNGDTYHRQEENKKNISAKTFLPKGNKQEQNWAIVPFGSWFFPGKSCQNKNEKESVWLFFLGKASVASLSKLFKQGYKFLTTVQVGHAWSEQTKQSKAVWIKTCRLAHERQECDFYRT